MTAQVRYRAWLALLLVVSVLLAACGDLTATPIPTPTALPVPENFNPPAATHTAVATPIAGPTQLPASTTPPQPVRPPVVDLPGGLLPTLNLPEFPGHQGEITAAAVSPDHNYLATGGQEGVVRLWQPATGRLLATLRGHIHRIHTLVFSPDSRMLASATWGYSADRPDYTVRVWDAPAGRELAVLKGHADGINDLAFSPDGRTLASAGLDEIIKLWDTAGWKEQGTIKARASNLRYSPDGRYLAGYDTTNNSEKNPPRIRLWETAGGRPAAEFISPLNQFMRTLIISPDSRHLAAVYTSNYPTTRNNLKVYEINGVKEALDLKDTGLNVSGLAFSPDGQRLLAGGNFFKGPPEISPFDGEPLDIVFITHMTGPTQAQVKSWETATGREVASWTLDGNYTQLVSFSPAGKPTALTTGDSASRWWSLESTTGKPVSTLAGAPAVLALAYSPDGRWLASGHSDHTIRLREAATGRELAVLKDHTAPVTALVFNSASNLLASGSRDYKIKIWDITPLPGGAPQLKHNLAGHRSWVNALTFSPDGRTLTSASSDTLIKLWDTATGQEKSVLKGHKYSVWALAYSPDGRTLASAGQREADKNNSKTASSIKLWDAATGQALNGGPAVVEPSTALAFSPDGRYLAGTSLRTYEKEATLKLWEVNGWRETYSFPLPFDRNSSPSQITGNRTFLSFAPNSKTLYSGYEDRGLDLWQVEATPAGQQASPVYRLPVSGPTGLRALALAPDGGALAAGYFDASIKTWQPVLSPPVPAAAPPPTPVPPPAFVPKAPPAAVSVKEKYATAPGSGHSSTVGSLAYSPDGRYLYSADGHGLIIQWNRASRQINRTFQGYGGLLALSRDGRQLASPTFTNNVLVWDTATGKLLLELKGHTERVHALAFSPDGLTLASAGGHYEAPKDTVIRLWRLADGREIARLDSQAGRIYYLAFRPDGRSLAAASYEGVIKVWNLPEGKPRATLLDLKDQQLQGLAYSPDGQLLATVNYMGHITFWDAVSDRKLGFYFGRMYTGSLTFTPDSRYLATGDAHSSGDLLVRLWDRNGKQVKTLPGPIETLKALAFSPDGRQLAGGWQGGISLEGDSDVLLWDVDAGQPLPPLKGYSGGSGHLYTSPDSRTFYSMVSKNTIKQYETATGRELASATLPYMGKSRLAVSPDGLKLAVLDDDKVIRFYEMPSGRPTTVIYGHGSASTPLVFSPDGKILAALESSARPRIRFWDAQSTNSREIGSLDLEGQMQNPFNALAYSPDGLRLAVGVTKGSGKDLKGSLLVYDLATSSLLSELKGHNYYFVQHAWFSPDGSLLASAAPDRTVRLWDIASGRELSVINGLSSSYVSAAFSPDGRFLATSEDGGLLHLWEVPSGRPLFRFELGQRLSRIAFSPDGKHLFGSFYNGITGVWEMQAS